MSELKFKDGAMKFINDISERVGTDLIYSLALDNNRWFFIVAADPAVTQKGFDTETGRIMFLIHTEDYESTQEDLIDQLVTQINSHVRYESNVLPEIPLPRVQK